MRSFSLGFNPPNRHFYVPIVARNVVGQVEMVRKVNRICNNSLQVERRSD